MERNIVKHAEVYTKELFFEITGKLGGPHGTGALLSLERHSSELHGQRHWPRSLSQLYLPTVQPLQYKSSTLPEKEKKKSANSVLRLGV